MSLDSDCREGGVLPVVASAQRKDADGCVLTVRSNNCDSISTKSDGYRASVVSLIRF